jgi:nucleoside-diphosphate-sugar epimerase
LHHLKSDLLDYKAVALEVVAIAPDVIVHLAARTEVEQSFYEQITFSEVNYVGTVNLIEAAARVKNLKNFVFASTMEVYGWQPISDVVKAGNVPDIFESFDEHTRPNPNAPYAVAKYGCEKYLEYAHRCYDLPFTAVRQTNSYGRKDNTFFVTEQIISQMLENPNEVNFGYGEPYRNFIFITDLLDAWIGIINNPDQVQGKIFTIGPDNAIKIKDYAQKIADTLNWKVKINWNTKMFRPVEIYWLNSNHNLITKTLGWKPIVSIDEGLDRTIEIWKKIYEK